MSQRCDGVRRGLHGAEGHDDEHQRHHGREPGAIEPKIDSTSSSVVRGFTKQKRSTVSPRHEVGTTKARPSSSVRSLQR